MNDFTASNGIGVSQHDDPKHWIVETLKRRFHLDPFEMQALREFFRAEEDERLGRWRSKESPDWTAVRRNTVVYFQCEDHERSFHIVVKYAATLTAWSPDLQKIAREYLAAHPEPKPWHDAEVGDVWALTFSGFEDDGPAPWTVRLAIGSDRVIQGREFVYPQNGNTIALDHAEIIDARRIWPEVSA